MLEDFMKLRRIQTDLEEVLDRLEHGVVSGIETPVDAETSSIKLEVPKSCDDCPVMWACVPQCHNGTYCKIMWEKIVFYFKKYIVHEA